MLYYEINTFFWYKCLFCAELLIAELLLALFLPKKKGFAWRFPTGLAACFLFSNLLPVADNAIIGAVLFFVIFIFTLFTIKFCFDTNWKTVIFCGIACYTIQHMANQMFDLFLFATGTVELNGAASGSTSAKSQLWLPFFTYGSGQGEVGGNIFVLMFYIGIYLVVYYISCKLLSRYVKNRGEVSIRNTFLLCMSCVFLIFDVFFSAVVSFYSSGNLDRGYIIMLDLYNIACCIFLLLIQFRFVLVNQLEREVEELNRILERRKGQYDLMCENIDLINIKCHDLKHQIRNIGDRTSISPLAIKEIENVISVYDCSLRTGNGALDVILTEKRLQCLEKKITMSCIVNGELLHFMSEVDIYSIFGNLLDNAIEAVMQLQDEAERVIGVSVKRVNGLIFVNVYNYYKGKIDFENGLPLSTKADSHNHGFGLKSVELIAKKYNGKLSVAVRDGIFSVSILMGGSGTKKE